MNMKDTGGKAPKKSFLYYYLMVMMVLMILNIFVFPSVRGRTESVRYDQFVAELEQGNIDEVYATTNSEIIYTLKNTDKLYLTLFS